MLKVAVVGCGYWGSHLLRNFNNSEKWELVYLCDIDREHLDKISNKFPNKKVTDNYKDILKDNEIDAVVIATPSNTHFKIAYDSLAAGKHVWVEKPFTQNTNDAFKLVELAKEKNLVINVDHTYIYTNAVKKIKEIIDSGELGDIIYIDAIRINLGLFRHDENVLWDLAPHDISMISYLNPVRPKSISATGNAYYKYSNKKLEESAYITIKYEDNSIAHINVNWLSPVKIRQVIIGATKKMLVFDDMQTVEKIKIYDSGVTLHTREEVYDTLVQYRTGDMYSPLIKGNEALATECIHFYDSITEGAFSDTSGAAGLLNVALLEAAQKSLENGGKEIIL